MALQVKRLRKKLGKNQAEFAELVGVTQPTISRWESGQDEPEGENLAKLARLAGQSLEEFAGYNEPPEIRVKRTTVVGSVQAGIWVEAVEWGLGERFEVSWSPDGKFDAFPKFGLKVKGTSMDKFYPEGSVVICVKFFHLDGRDPRHQERVVVHRRRADGLFEATIKEFFVDRDGAWLWPRSNDPNFQSPTRYPPNDRDSESVEIYALVIGSYSPESVSP